MDRKTTTILAGLQICAVCVCGRLLPLCDFFVYGCCFTLAFVILQQYMFLSTIGAGIQMCVFAKLSLTGTGKLNLVLTSSPGHSL